MPVAAPPLAAEGFARLLEAEAARSGHRLSTEVVSSLSRYLALLDRWRRQTNLTGRLEARDLVEHALESVAGEVLIPPGVEVLDVGSGAGFPGIPLAVARPDLRVTALEIRRKRAEFLRHVARTLPTANCLVLDRGPSDLKEGFFDVAMSRAVGGIGRILGDAPFLKPGGAFLAWTTDAEGLARTLSPLFSLETAIPVPETRRKVIARFRKSG